MGVASYYRGNEVIDGQYAAERSAADLREVLRREAVLEARERVPARFVELHGRAGTLRRVVYLPAEDGLIAVWEVRTALGKSPWSDRTEVRDLVLGSTREESDHRQGEMRAGTYDGYPRRTLLDRLTELLYDGRIVTVETPLGTLTAGLRGVAVDDGRGEYEVHVHGAAALGPLGPLAVEGDIDEITRRLLSLPALRARVAAVVRAMEEDT